MWIYKKKSKHGNGYYIITKYSVNTYSLPILLIDLLMNFIRHYAVVVLLVF